MPSASDLFADLTRSQWNDYVREIVPYENKLIQFATDPTVVSSAMTEASKDATGAFDRQANATQENLRSLGLNLTADEQRAVTRSTGLSRSLADVQAQNSARDTTRSLQQSLLGNPIPSIGSM